MIFGSDEQKKEIKLDQQIKDPFQIYMKSLKHSIFQCASNTLNFKNIGSTFNAIIKAGGLDKEEILSDFIKDIKDIKPNDSSLNLLLMFIFLVDGGSFEITAEHWRFLLGGILDEKKKWNSVKEDIFGMVLNLIQTRDVAEAPADIVVKLLIELYAFFKSSGGKNKSVHEKQRDKCESIISNLQNVNVIEILEKLLKQNSALANDLTLILAANFAKPKNGKNGCSWPFWI